MTRENCPRSVSILNSSAQGRNRPDSLPIDYKLQSGIKLVCLVLFYLFIFFSIHFKTFSLYWLASTAAHLLFEASVTDEQKYLWTKMSIVALVYESWKVN